MSAFEMRAVGPARRRREKPESTPERNNMMLSIRHKWVMQVGRQTAIVWQIGAIPTDRR
jgi:hypothetical protein